MGRKLGSKNKPKIDKMSDYVKEIYITHIILKRLRRKE